MKFLMQDHPLCPRQVPLWVALNLRQRQKCRIVQPEWMAPDRLEAARDAERESPFFAELPAPDLFAVAQLVLDVSHIVDDVCDMSK